MFIKTQKYLLFIPIANFLSVFFLCDLIMKAVPIKKRTTLTFKTIVKFFVVLFFFSVLRLLTVRLLIAGLWYQIATWTNVYFVLFFVSLIGIKEQEKIYAKYLE